MRNKIILLLILLIIPFSSSFAFEYDFSGKAEIFGTYYVKEDGNKELEWGRIKIIPELKMNHNYFSAFIQGEICQDSEEGYSGSIDDISEDERWLLNLKSGYFEYNYNWLQLKAGKCIYNWSKIDLQFPSDNINSRDWYDLVEYDRVGSPSADLRIGYDSYVEIIYLPYYLPSKLPGQNLRWGMEMSPGMIFNETRYDDGYNPQYAAKIGTLIKDYSLYATYYNGYSYSPSFTVKIVPPSHNEVIIQDGSTFIEEIPGGVYIVPWNDKEEVITIGTSCELFGFIFHSEIGYFDQKKEDDFIQYIIGFDRVVDDIFIESDSFYYLFQYIGDKTIKNGREKPFDYFDLRRLFDVMGRLKYSFDEYQTYSIQLDFTVNTEDEDTYFEPSLIVDYDNYEVQLGVGIFSGPEDSFWGKYKNNDRLFIKGTYYF